MVRGGREGGVYELIFSDSLDEEQKAAVRTEDMVALRPFVPRYCELPRLLNLMHNAHAMLACSKSLCTCTFHFALHASADGIVEADGKKLLALDDSCHGYQQPCVLDAKVSDTARKPLRLLNRRRPVF